MKTTQLTEQALAGIRVLDLTRVLAGPYCTMTLGDLGAEIIKVETPRGGDDTRVYRPLNADGESIYFVAVNRNKRSVAIDFSRPQGQRLIRDLAAKSDVLVENFRFGALKRFGLDYDAIATINPQIIYCSISGFGRNSPMKERPGYDFVAQAESGLMSITGETDGTPVKVGVPISDLAAGMNATQAVLAALFHRERTGKGQMIDIALFDSIMGLLPLQVSETFTTGIRPGRFANAHPSIVPYQSFRASDAHFVLAIANDLQFASLCKVIGKPAITEDKRYATNAARAQYRDELVPLLEAMFAKQPVDYWLSLLNEASIPCGRIRYVDEALNAPEVTGRGLIQSITSQRGSHIRVLGSPLKLEASPVRAPSPPPLLGEHTTDVLTDLLGLGPDELQALRAAAVIGAQAHSAPAPE